jgi:hypothetical protein
VYASSLSIAVLPLAQKRLVPTAVTVTFVTRVINGCSLVDCTKLHCRSVITRVLDMKGVRQLFFEREASKQASKVWGYHVPVKTGFVYDIRGFNKEWHRRRRRSSSSQLLPRRDGSTVLLLLRHLLSTLPAFANLFSVFHINVGLIIPVPLARRQVLLTLLWLCFPRYIVFQCRLTVSIRRYWSIYRLSLDWVALVWRLWLAKLTGFTVGISFKSWQSNSQVKKLSAVMECRSLLLWSQKPTTKRYP